MHYIARFQLSQHRPSEDAPKMGLSCDENGVVLAGKMALVRRDVDACGRSIFRSRPMSEINLALSEAYEVEVDFSDRAELLRLAAEAMTAGNWTRATIAAVYLRLPDLPDQAARDRLQKAVTALKHTMVLSQTREIHSRRPDKQWHQRRVTGCSCEAPQRNASTLLRRDVSDEPRVPRGQTGGGQWTTDGSTGDGASERPLGSILHPVQAVPIPFPGTVPIPLTPRLLPPIPLIPPILDPEGLYPQNPFPERADCRAEWEFAHRECAKLQAQGKLGPKGNRWAEFGRNMTKCLLGMVSEECGGNPTDKDGGEERPIA